MGWLLRWGRCVAGRRQFNAAAHVRPQPPLIPNDATPQYSPVAVHDGHAEGRKGVARRRLDLVQQLKQRRALRWTGIVNLFVITTAWKAAVAME